MEMSKQLEEIKALLQMKTRPKAFVARNASEFEDIPIDDATKAALKGFHFNPWNYEFNEIMCLMEIMLVDLGVVDEFSIDINTLRRWLMCVRDNYHDVPFHNFRHAFSVAQMLYSLTHLCQLHQVLTKRDISVIMIACICLDIDHPGLTTSYQMNAQTDLAILYNDNSPLENHHSSISFRILANPDLNILSNLSRETFREIRRQIIVMILASDMGRHKPIMEEFNLKMIQFDMHQNDHREMFMQLIVKVCDASTEVRPSEVSSRWVDSLLDEYFLQGDREKREGLPMSMYMDRSISDKRKGQIAFLRFILIPMYECLGNLLPSVKDTLLPRLTGVLSKYELQETDMIQNDALKLGKMRVHSSLIRRKSRLSSDGFE